MNCPVCTKPCNTILTCPDCWAKVPTKDRMQFHAMHRHGQNTVSKGDAIIRKLRAQLPVGGH